MAVISDGYLFLIFLVFMLLHFINHQINKWLKGNGQENHQPPPPRPPPPSFPFQRIQQHLQTPPMIQYAVSVCDEVEENYKRINLNSGVRVNAECQVAFQQLSEGKKLRYIIYKIDDDKQVTNKFIPKAYLAIGGDEHEENSKTAFEIFVKDLKARTDGFQDCRYAVFDFKFTTHRPGAGAAKMNKIVFIQLCPDGASIKKKMLYASSAQAIKASLGTERMLQFQVSDESGIAHKELMNKLNEKYRDN